jgi:hypothetical protein
MAADRQNINKSWEHIQVRIEVLNFLLVLKLVMVP